MKAFLTAALIGSAAVLAVPQVSNAFSLTSMLGVHERQSAEQGGAADAGNGRNMVMAQAADGAVRMQQLEEEVRKLTGRVQDLNYQLLQTQEQIRQMQKDNEFRFQRLEGAAGLGGGAGTGTSAAPTPPAANDHTQNMAAPSAGTAQASRALPGVEAGTTASTTTAPNVPGRGAPPKSLGTVTFDANGKIIGDSMAAPGANASGTQTASLPSSSSPQDIYRAAYNQLLNGNYKAAENGFHDYIDVFPDGPQASDAAYWLGESQFSQGKFNDAARTFLDAHQKYPKAKKAPETLLKLGMALAALNNQDTACATYSEVLKRYPDVSAEVRRKVAREEKRTGC
ncbi:MAG TPA: tol-pal system protein YbgF [Pararhizobium sp.]|nr:tol-pal system protein YbgF [Pararhizobium sp.]